MTKSLLENSSNVRGPLLMVANAHALFRLADALKHAERDYLTLRDHDHNDFIDQGLVRRALKCDEMPGDRALQTELESARAGYEAVCEYALAFFDCYLKNQTDRHTELVKRYRQTTFGGDQPHVERLPVGATGPEPYRDAPDAAPTLRQVSLIVAERGAAPAITVLKRWREKAPQAFVLQTECAFALVDESLSQGRIEDAIAINRFFGSNDAAFFKLFVKKGDGCRRAGLKSFALDYYRKACLARPHRRRGRRAAKRALGGKDKRI
jgi:hypothetical protein